MKVSDPVEGSGDAMLESREKDGMNNDEKVSLTETDKWTDKELPVVVIEDQSNLIISMFSNKFYFT